MSRIAIVAGALGSKPMHGGFAWVPLSYALGLRRLGFDVYLLEHMGAPSSVNRTFFRDVAREFGFEGRSALLANGGTAAGIDESCIREVASEAELLVNISGHAKLDWIVSGPRLSAYIDTDPGFTQIWNRDGLLHASIASHSHHFSVGSNVGQNGCLVPDDGIDWHPTAPPVVLEQWPVLDGGARQGVRFTTVASWRCPSGVVSLDGKTVLPSKLHGFRRMLPLPSMVEDACFEIALDIQPADATDRENLQRGGWTLVDPQSAAGDPCGFRAYVAGSGAEFSTVQGVYSAANTGWISDRSVRYLASGRPVVVEDTGVSGRLAGGEGMLTFTSLQDARRSVERIITDYPAQSAAARRLAETHFDSDLVLGDLLDLVGAKP